MMTFNGTPSGFGASWRSLIGKIGQKNEVLSLSKIHLGPPVLFHQRPLLQKYPMTSLRKSGHVSWTHKNIANWKTKNQSQRCLNSFVVSTRCSNQVYQTSMGSTRCWAKPFLVKIVRVNFAAKQTIFPSKAGKAKTGALRKPCRSPFKTMVRVRPPHFIKRLGSSKLPLYFCPCSAPMVAGVSEASAEAFPEQSRESRMVNPPERADSLLSKN